MFLLQECTGCWISEQNADTIQFRFQQSLFIVVEELAASGHGLVVPRTDGHMALTNILMVIGRMLECYILGELSNKSR